MQKLFVAATAGLFSLAPTPSAVQLQRGLKPLQGDTHLSNLADDEVSPQPGDYDLLRMPVERTAPALINLRGTFMSDNIAECGLYMKNFTLRGDWLGGQIVHVRWMNNNFEMKVSTIEPPKAGRWEAVDNSTTADLTANLTGIDAIGETLELARLSKGPALKFQVGPRSVHRRPVILLSRGSRHAGLDVSLFNVKDVQGEGSVPEAQPSLLGKEEVERALSEQCGATSNPEYVVSGNKHIWDLAREGLDASHAGDHELLRMPKNKSKPTLIALRGSFVSSPETPCGQFIKNFTLSGLWLAEKTLHVRHTVEGVEFKVSSTVPQVAGKWMSLENATLPNSRIKALPDTIKMTQLPDGSAFKFHIGPKHSGKRPAILVAENPNKGLDFSIFYMKKLDLPDRGNLLSADKNRKNLLTCKPVDNSATVAEHVQRLGGASQLTTSWLMDSQM